MDKLLSIYGIQLSIFLTKYSWNIKYTIQKFVRFEKKTEYIESIQCI
jgi:hypothetical protein